MPSKLIPLILAVFSIIFGLLLSEVILASLDQPKFFKSPVRTKQFSFFQKMESNEIVYYNVPLKNFSIFYGGYPRNYFGKFNEVDHFNNSWGFRGPEFEGKKNKSSIRVAFIGDSFTYGEGVWFKDTVSELTAQSLNERYKQDPLFNVYNFGVGGHNTKQSLYVFENKVLKIEPHIVVLGYHINDIEPSLFFWENEKQFVGEVRRTQLMLGQWAEQKPPENIFFELRFVKFTWKFIKNFFVSEKTIDFYRSLYDKDEKQIEVKNNLKKFKGLCGKNKLNCFVMIYPIYFKLEKNYPFKEIHNFVKDVGGAVGLKTIDLLPHFEGKQSELFWVDPLDHHPNERANKIVSDVLQTTILEDNAFRELILNKIK